MSGRETAARIAELRRRLDDASNRYHVLDDPDIPDAEYDAMLRELDELEAAHPEFADPNSPTQRVGFAASGRFEPVAQAVVLGCTEISLLVGPGDSTVPLLDTTALHALAAVDFALHDQPE